MVKQANKQSYDVINDEENNVNESPVAAAVASPEVPSTKKSYDAEKIASLSVNEKYAIVLENVRQSGPLFFVTVNPSVFKLPDRDPLNLIWINLLTSWTLASNMLSQFDAHMQMEQRLQEANEELNERDTDESVSSD